MPPRSRPTPDPLTIVNLSVWTSVGARRAFVFGGLHTDFLRRRREWFVPAERTTAMWWVPVGEHPTVDDATARLAALAGPGATPYAFGLRTADERLPSLAQAPLA